MGIINRQIIEMLSFIPLMGHQVEIDNQLVKNTSGEIDVGKIYILKSVIYAQNWKLWDQIHQVKGKYSVKSKKHKI